MGSAHGRKEDLMKTTTMRRATAVALAALSLGIAACGDDESTTTAAEETTSTTTSTEESTTSTTSTATEGSFADAASALEADGFELEEKSGDELVQSAGLPKPVTASAGAVATRSGSAGDVLVWEFASPEDAEAYAKANNDDVLTTEVVGTIAVSSTTDNTDLLDQALAAIGG
jgi:hypothetical protein